MALIDLYPKLVPSRSQSSVIARSDLVCIFGEHVVVLSHHAEPFAEVGEPGAQVHLAFKFIKYLLVVEVSVGEKPVHTPHNVVQVLL